MSEEKIVLDVNAATGEETLRPMNEQELAIVEQDAINDAKQAAILEEQKAAKLALFDRLGITEEEAQLLLS